MCEGGCCDLFPWFYLLAPSSTPHSSSRATDSPRSSCHFLTLQNTTCLPHSISTNPRKTKLTGGGGGESHARGDSNIGKLADHNSEVYRNMGIMELGDKAAVKGIYGCCYFQEKTSRAWVTCIKHVNQIKRSGKKTESATESWSTPGALCSITI